MLFIKVIHWKNRILLWIFIKYQNSIMAIHYNRKDFQKCKKIRIKSSLISLIIINRHTALAELLRQNSLICRNTLYQWVCNQVKKEEKIHSILMFVMVNTIWSSLIVSVAINDNKQYIQPVYRNIGLLNTDECFNCDT